MGALVNGQETGSQDIVSAAQANSPWIVAVAMALWSWLLKLALGRHLRAYDEDRKETRDFMKEIRDRLGKIEGRFTERDHSHGR